MTLNQILRSLRLPQDDMNRATTYPINSLDRYTLRLHRRLRGIAGFRAATLPGLEHTLAAQWLLGQPRVASASR